jgi:DNA-binding transcriptional MerR regulator/methylmalonyl-CoA mutase cobalamin-binding subunit
MDITATATLPIRTISSLTGVNAVTLRAWERRYGIVRPARTPKGHRLYSHQHVERIRRVLALMDRGVPIGRVRDLIDAEPAAEPTTAADQWRKSLDRMAAAIANFDEPELDRIYDEALGVYPVEQVTRRLLLPLLVHLGERWRDLAGGIAEEHFFSMYLRSKLGARLQHRMRYAVGARVLASCAPGEQHEIGLLLFALQAHAAGLQTVLLGADTPVDEIVIARQRSAARAVVLSSSLQPAEDFLSGELPRLVREAGCPVFVGGDTALARRREIVAAGATPLCVPIEEGVRLLKALLAEAGDAP